MYNKSRCGPIRQTDADERSTALGYYSASIYGRTCTPTLNHASLQFACTFVNVYNSGSEQGDRRGRAGKQWLVGLRRVEPQSGSGHRRGG
eukprot:6173899-Pleurochrysis_carterae.AAC.3